MNENPDLTPTQVLNLNRAVHKKTAHKSTKNA